MPFRKGFQSLLPAGTTTIAQLPHLTDDFKVSNYGVLGFSVLRESLFLLARHAQSYLRGGFQYVIKIKAKIPMHRIPRG